MKKNTRTKFENTSKPTRGPSIKTEQKNFLDLILRTDKLEDKVWQGTPPALREEKISHPLILKSTANKDYALIDSGNGLKLERFGPYTIIRPEGQALWAPHLDLEAWRTADALFTGNTEEEGLGRWDFLKKPLAATWPMRWRHLSFLGRFTSFRHVGYFPEQEAHWLFMQNIIKTRLKQQEKVEVLNLFGYTGLASLIAADAGAHVTHIDASKKAIGWARENQEIAHLQDKPIRWICEDAVKFVLREVRRQKKYDIILLDPPAFGRGPQGEVWRLFEDLPNLLQHCCTLLSVHSSCLILTAYTIRASFYALDNLMWDHFKHLPGCIESGELLIQEEVGHRVLSTSLFSRWTNKI